MARPRMMVEAPPVTPLPYGLLSAALVLDDLDGHAQMGVQYEPEPCAPASRTRAACESGPDYGDVSISVANTGEATISAGDAPPSAAYVIEWGDGTTTVTPDLDGQDHTYADPDDYTVRITDRTTTLAAVVVVTVVDGQTSGPFDAEFGINKVPTTGIDLVEGDPFTLYVMFNCAPVGVDLEARAASALRLGEQRGVETATAERLPLAEGAVDLTPTPGTPMHPVDGVALLEQYAAANYGGVPTFHLPRGLNTVLMTHGTVIRSGVRLETGQGALVAAGGGYSDLAGPASTPGDASTVIPAGAGEAWLYVTGQVVVRRAPRVEATPMTMARNPVATNDATVLAERPYVVSWECVTAAVLVTSDFAVTVDGGGA